MGGRELDDLLLFLLDCEVLEAERRGGGGSNFNARDLSIGPRWWAFSVWGG